MTTKLLIILFFLGLILVSCRDDDDDGFYYPSIPIVAYVGGDIEGESLDSAVVDCIEFHLLHDNGLVRLSGETSFVHKQGQKFRYSSGDEVTFTLIIYDTTIVHTAFTPQLLEFYINEENDQTLLLVEVKKNDVIYRNWWMVGWSNIDLIVETKSVDPNEVSSITTFSPNVLECAENWPKLDLLINYEGKLVDENYQDTIQVNLESKIFLLQFRY